MIVMKFGGTAVGTAKRMEQVVELVAGSVEHKPVLVLSAMSGITNALIAGAEKAFQHDLLGAMREVSLIRSRHLETIAELFADKPAGQPLVSEMEARLEELAILYKGINYLGELTKRSLDAVSGIGELLSSRIVAVLARERGLKSQWLDAREFLITDDTFGRANPRWNELTPRVREMISPLASQGTVPITQGFIGATAFGASTTLGRGGSDYSATIIGVAAEAEEIQIWTDVEGMMSADPSVIPDAQVLPEVSFQEASELAYFGAKVLHPLTIKPAIEKNIPVSIRNAFRPEQAGTVIKDSVKSDDTIRAIAAKKGITAVFISSPKMLMSHGFLADVFAVFARRQIPIDLISTSEISVALTIDQTDQVEALTADLAEHGEVRLVGEAAIVSVVGRQFRERSGIAGQVFAALSDINIIMISGGASDINLSFVVAESDADRALKQLHSRFFSRPQAIQV